MSERPSNKRKWLISAAIALGVAVGAASIANAVADDGHHGERSESSRNNDHGDDSKRSGAKSDDAEHDDHDHHDEAHYGNRTDKFGPRGNDITGATADKVAGVALAKYDGGEVERVMQLADGSYEVHVFTKAGDEVRVTVSKDLKVTATVPGGRGPGRDRRNRRWP